MNESACTSNYTYFTNCYFFKQYTRGNNFFKKKNSKTQWRTEDWRTDKQCHIEFTFYIRTTRRWVSLYPCIYITMREKGHYSHAVLLSLGEILGHLQDNVF